MAERIIVIGSDSRIGAAVLTCCLRAAADVIGTTRRSEFGRIKLDLSDSGSFARAISLRCTQALICAAISGDEAIDRTASAREINVTGTIELMRQLVAAGTHVWFISTNMVFDGSAAAPTHDELPSPKTTYGAWKAEVEAFIRRECPGRGSVVRLTKVLPPEWPLGHHTLDSVRAHSGVEAFHDWRFSPILLSDVATALARLLTERPRRTPPVFHLSALDTISYADGVAYLAGLAGGHTHQVRPTSIVSRRTVAWNPRYTALACEWESAHLGWPRRTSLETLRQWYEQERHAV